VSYESTQTEDKTEARRKLKGREGQVASGLHHGPQTERTRFEDLVDGIRQDYALNERKSVRWLNEFITHLSAHFKQLRASAITTDRVKEYVATRREEGTANGTINRELAWLKRMFKLALQSTPQKVARIPHIPMLEEHNVRSGFFSHEEYLAVHGVLPDYAQVAVSIAYYTGLRIGEVLGLKWSQVDLGGQTFTNAVADQNRNIQGSLSASRSTPHLVGGKATTRGHISRLTVGLPALWRTIAGD
jgi:integrase